MVSFENFVKSLPPSLSELKVKPIFCFPIKIRDDPTASIIYHQYRTSNLFNRRLEHYSKGFTNHFMTIEVLNVFTKVFIAKTLQNEQKRGW